MAKSNRTGILIVVLLVVVFAAFLLVAIRMDTGGNMGGIGKGAGKVGIIPLEGVIADSRDFVKKLYAFRDDDSIKAIVIYANSPGGAVGPSQELFEEIKYVRKDKPVVTSIGAVCASGCYYAAIGSQRIFSNPGSLVGSIGVIIPLWNAKELFDWAKVQPQFVKSAPLKDIGNPAKALEPREREALQAVVDGTHEQFVQAVASGRAFAGMTTDEVRAVATGQVFTGEQALEKEMIDELGTLRQAVRYAGELGGLSGEPEVKYPPQEKPALLELLLTETRGFLGDLVMKGSPPGQPSGTYFLWNP